MASSTPKPWSVAIFERERMHLTTFLNDRVVPLLDARECRRILIRAPVKCGKREMAEYLAIRDHQAGPAARVHAFISAWHRTADEMQRDELRHHNLRVFPVTSDKNANECLKWVRENVGSGKEVVLHLDECDYGSGEHQSLSIVYRAIREDERIFTILYSATPQEVLFSGEVEEDEHQEMIQEIMQGERVEYTPPPGYCGPARFLDVGLIFEAEPFFYPGSSRGTICLSAQGAKIVSDLKAEIARGSARNIIVLRLSYSELTRGQGKAKKDNKAIYQFLHGISSVPELADCSILMDKGEKAEIGRGALADNIILRNINWSKKQEWMLLGRDRPIIVVIDQTSSRSTEWVCHDRIFATHDYRNKVTYSIVSQAQERVNHYEQRYGGFQPIRVYGHRKTFLLSAGRIDYNEYMKVDWEIRKVDQRRMERDGLGTEPLYEVRSTAGNHALHLRYPNPLTKEAADIALQGLGCAAEIAVSARVRGGIRDHPVFGVEFYPCTKDTFPALMTILNTRVTGHRFRLNPFVRSEEQGLVDGKYKGYLREWRVFDYDQDIRTQPRWGSGAHRLTICYRAGQLGVALRYDTGRREQVNTLETFKSMYASV